MSALRPTPTRLAALVLLALLAACRGGAPGPAGGTPIDSGPRRLPTGARLDPVGRVDDVGPMPLTMLRAPELIRRLVADDTETRGGRSR